LLLRGLRRLRLLLRGLRLGLPPRRTGRGTLLSRGAIALRLLRILVCPRAPRAGAGPGGAPELLPLSGELIGPGAVLLHHFSGRARDESSIIEALAQPLQLRLRSRDLLLHPRL